MPRVSGVGRGYPEGEWGTILSAVDSSHERQNSVIHSRSYAQHIPAGPLPVEAGDCTILREGCHCQPHPRHFHTGQLSQDFGTGWEAVGGEYSLICWC